MLQKVNDWLKMNLLYSKIRRTSSISLCVLFLLFPPPPLLFLFFFFNGSTLILSYRWHCVLYCSSSSKKKDKSDRICLYFLLLVAVVKDTLSFFINPSLWTCLTHFIFCIPFTTPSACAY